MCKGFSLMPRAEALMEQLLRLLVRDERLWGDEAVAALLQPGFYKPWPHTRDQSAII
jgi:hypothetical protein